jgi:hypothetical protein
MGFKFKGEAICFLYFPGVLDGNCNLKLFFGKSQHFFCTMMGIKKSHRFLIRWPFQYFNSGKLKISASSSSHTCLLGFHLPVFTYGSSGTGG